MQALTKEYIYLFHMIERTQQELHRLEEMLIQAQRTAEDIYLDRTESEAEA